eukprot:2528414-Pyramimonas_sp.AAC.1
MIALSVVKTALRMLTAGRGPGGWLGAGREKPRHTQWSYEEEKEGLFVLNELYRRGGCVRLRPGFRAIYVHVGDGLSAAACPRGGSADKVSEQMIQKVADAWEQA